MAFSARAAPALTVAIAIAIATDVMPMGTLPDDADVASTATSLATAAPSPVLASVATLDLPRKRGERFGKHSIAMLSR